MVRSNLRLKRILMIALRKVLLKNRKKIRKRKKKLLLRGKEGENLLRRKLRQLKSLLRVEEGKKI